MCAAITAGLRKVLARMGVSTLARYRNSYLFEIVGCPNSCAQISLKMRGFCGAKIADDLLANASHAFQISRADHPAILPRKIRGIFKEI